HLGRELDRARVGVRPVRVEGQLAHLRRRRLADLVAIRVADLHREQPGERVEVALAVRILEIAAFAADDDRHLAVSVAAHPREVEPEVVAYRLLQLGRREGRRDGGHAASFERRIWTRMLTSAAVSAITKMAVPITFTCGGAPILAAPQTKSGNVTL